MKELFQKFKKNEEKFPKRKERPETREEKIKRLKQEKKKNRLFLGCIIALGPTFCSLLLSFLFQATSWMYVSLSILFFLIFTAIFFALITTRNKT